MSEVEGSAAEQLRPRIYKRGVTYDLQMEDIQVILIVLVVVPVCLVSALILLPLAETFAWLRFLILIEYMVGLLFIFLAGFLAKLRRRGFTRNKDELFAGLHWMTPNALEAAWTTTRALLVKSVDVIEPEELMGNVYEAVTGVKLDVKRSAAANQTHADNCVASDESLAKVRAEGFEALAGLHGEVLADAQVEKIVSSIQESMPRNAEGAPYVWVRYGFENTFPSLVEIQRKDGTKDYREGDTLFSSCLILTDPAHVHPAEIWDRGRYLTKLMGVEDDDQIFQADLDIWGIYQATGEPICTVGLSRMHRHTMRSAMATHAPKTVLEFLLLLRETLKSASSQLRSEHYAEGFTELLDGKVEGAAIKQGIEVVKGSEISGWRLWVQDHGLGLALLLFIVAVGIIMMLNALGVFTPKGLVLAPLPLMLSLNWCSLLGHKLKVVSIPSGSTADVCLRCGRIIGLHLKEGKERR